MEKLTVLSFGGGQDSTTILAKFITKKSLLKQYAPGDFLVIMSDTGNEHIHTYDHVEICKHMCKKAGIEFILITSEMGYHTAAWPNLIEPQTRKSGSEFKNTMVQAGTKSCTDKLKLGPIYKFLDAWINKKYNYGIKVQKNGGCLKKALKRFQKENGKIDVLIGFAKGEEKRADKSIQLEAKEQLSKGWSSVIHRVFPLIEWGMDREKCLKYLSVMFDYDVMPSNCMLCPYQSLPELLWLERKEPKMIELWIDIENRKLDSNKHLEGTVKENGKEFKNQGVYMGKTLPQKMKEAKAKFGHMSTSDLHEFKKTRSCSTNSM